MPKKPEPNRYHFTDEKPFKVTTAEGEVELGLGWLAITEEEYKDLSARPKITQRQLDALKRDRRELRDREDNERAAYLAKPYYTEEDMLARLPQGAKRVR